MSYLTAVVKIRANNHDRARLTIALGRWHAGFSESLDQARARQSELLRCLTLWTPKNGGKPRLVVDGKALHALTLNCVPKLPHLHSSARMSMVVAVEAQLKSYLGLYAEWINGGRKEVKPGFPEVPPATPEAAHARWLLALDRTAAITTLSEEREWSAAISRAAKGTLLPQYFGSTMSGSEKQAHCGVLRRQDGRWFALLTLFPQGDLLGEPVTRARNRQKRGEVQNCRVDTPFRATDRARASIMVPLEMDRRTERLYFERGVPKSAELVRKGEEFYLHVACEVTESPSQTDTGAVLAAKRGITTLAACVVLSEDGREVTRHAIDDKGLARLITEITSQRAVRQQKGKLTTGDRRASRTTEEHLHLLAHDIVRLARERGVRQIVVLQDPEARKPQRMLKYKHWSELFNILARCCTLAGLPAPIERKIYGSWRTCLECGWCPSDPVRLENPEFDQCGGCGTRRDSEYHLASLLAHDTLRLRNRKPDQKLGDYFRALR